MFATRTQQRHDPVSCAPSRGVVWKKSSGLHKLSLSLLLPFDLKQQRSRALINQSFIPTCTTQSCHSIALTITTVLSALSIPCLLPPSATSMITSSRCQSAFAVHCSTHCWARHTYAQEQPKAPCLQLVQTNTIHTDHATSADDYTVDTRKPIPHLRRGDENTRALGSSPQLHPGAGHCPSGPSQ